MHRFDPRAIPNTMDSGDRSSRRRRFDRRNRKRGSPREPPIDVAPAISTQQPYRRVTRSSAAAVGASVAASEVLSSSHRPQVVVGPKKRSEALSEPKVAAASFQTSQKPTKKAKTSAHASVPSSLTTSALPSRRTYNLRATTARSSQRTKVTETGVAAIITPRTPAIARQIDFKDTSQQHQPPAALPPGVVNIFSRERTVRCSCASNRCVMTDTSVGFSHIHNYGEENGELLKDAESRQVEAIKRLLPANSHDSSTVDTNSEFMDDDDSSSDEGDDPGFTASRASRGRTSSPANRRVNLQNAFASVGVSTIHQICKSRFNVLLRQPYLSPRMRGVLVHWLAEVGQEYKVSDTAFHLSVSILDHLLLKGPTQEELDAHDDKDDDTDGPWFLVNRSDFQAIGW